MADDESESEIPVLTPPTVEAGEITDTLVRITHLTAIDATSMSRIVASALGDAGVTGVIALGTPSSEDVLRFLEGQLSVDLIPRAQAMIDGRRAYVERLYDDRIVAPEGYEIRQISAGHAASDADGVPRTFCYVWFEPEY